MGRRSSWIQIARALEKAQKQTARNRQRQEREELKQAKAFERMEAAAQARQEVAQFENFLAMLTSLHKSLGDTVNWTVVRDTPPPPPPIRQTNREYQAKLSLASYKPGFFDKLFGHAQQKLEELQMQVAMAQHGDDQQYQQEYSEYRENHETWSMNRKLANHILAGDTEAYMAAMRQFDAFSEVESYGSKVFAGAATLDALLMQVQIADDLVPDEVVKLTASGKRSTSAMPAGRYWELYQDHVCSCAIRLANEAFSILPVVRVIVNLGRFQPNPATGHNEFATFLAVHFVSGCANRKLIS
jgi:hypothetical protein